MAWANARQFKRRAAAIAALPNPSKLTLDHCKWMPDTIAPLINGNYRFLTYCRWEQQHDGLVLRAGGSDYLVYNKGDDFGGQEVIARLEGWLDYITEVGRRVDVSQFDAA